jgi:hypothetical protein
LLFIAFGHRKRVGKDTAARFLSAYLRLKKKGLDIQQKGFGDKVKDITHQLYGWAGLQPGHYYEKPENAHLIEQILPRIGKSPRQIWIEFATKVAREVYADTWLDYVLQTTEGDVCILKDLRFPNEAHKILDFGGYIYKINRADAPNNSDLADDQLVEFNQWTKILDNNGSIKEFHDKITTEIGDTILAQLNE